MMGIEWSLRTFASMRALRLFLRRQAVHSIRFVLRAVSTSENADGEQPAQHFVNFLAAGILVLLERKSCFAPSYLAGTFKTGHSKYAQS